MDLATLWLLAVVANTLVYAWFLNRRGEAGIAWSLVVAVLLGPLVWFVWFSTQAGRERSQVD